jgi:hypothetical protein
MPVKNKDNNNSCDRAFYLKKDNLKIIMCNKEFNLVCSHAKMCSKYGHFILKDSSLKCPYNRMKK